MFPQEKLTALDAKGELYWPKARSGGDNFPRIKQRPVAGNPIQDCIFDIAALNSQARERLGYPQSRIAVVAQVNAHARPSYNELRSRRFFKSFRSGRKSKWARLENTPKVLMGWPRTR